MRTVSAEQIYTALAQFSSDRRLYALTIGDGAALSGSVNLLVEAFTADDAVQGVGARDIIALATDAHIPLTSLLGQAAALKMSLADGSRVSFGGNVSRAEMLGSEGGFARYRLRLTPWLWRLSQAHNSRVWQEKTVCEIVDAVFEAHLPLAQWRWSDETPAFMRGAIARSYCCQYRESDLDFVQRLLTEEGLAWRFEHGEHGAVAVIFADSTQLSATSEDPSSRADGGIRFHNARAGERQDTVLALRAQRNISASMSTVLSYDYKAKRVVGASAPSRLPRGKMLPELESFDVPGQYAFANLQQAQRYADLHMQGHEARSHLWRGRSTVRTLRAGTRLTILGTPLAQLGEAPAFTLIRVISVGVNNLPALAQHALAELFGPIPELLQEFFDANMPDDFALAVAQAIKTGYANCFEAVPADVPWRAQVPDRPRATARGSQSAIVVGADGSDQPNGADELYCDRLGRVRIRFHWQESGEAGCWVRVAQRAAGGGMGSQFLPRIGQEVLVQFLENDIDRPIIVGALYNGQGEGGVAPTPGGRSGAETESSPFKAAHDHAASAQGNIAGGNSPLWHGASSDSAGHRNGAAQWGVRSKEFGASGYNQLMFDDTDAQGRIQLKCSFAATELNLGHLVHGAANYRGSLRGNGAELRTDAYGAVRAGAGLLISSYRIDHTARSRDPAGDNVAGIALIKQAVMLAKTFSKAAMTHRTVALASDAGAAKAGASVINDKAAPLEALLAAVSGMVGKEKLDAARADAADKAVKPGADKVPHLTEAIIAIAAKKGLGVSAGHSMQLASGETVTLMSGMDTQFIGGEQMRMHSGQALGVLSGVVQPGEGNLGLQVIAAGGAIDLQAQADELKVQARDEVNVMSTNAHIDWAAAKSISLSTAGGANITISGGNITVQCPGKITVHAGVKSLTGPARSSYRLPVLPVSIVERVEGSVLESTFAIDQLTAYAKSSTKGEFLAFLLPVFGFDIPPQTYFRLYDGLRLGTIQNAKIVVMSGGNYPAEFENQPPEIRVHQAAVDRAVKHTGEAWELLAALLHEFGHYIDALLRHELADKNNDGTAILDFDSSGEEGSRFAYAIASFDLSGTSETEFARYSSPIFTGPLKVKYREARASIMKAQSAEAKQIERKKGTVEFFPAAPEHKEHLNESFGHETIETALTKVGGRFMSDAIRQQIYFGNWLRDNSQLLDPKVVRAPSDPKDMTRHLSRATLTKLVGLMAKKKFGHTPAARTIFEVTESRLGVYRAVEHIDNPTNEVPGRDPREIDKDFEPLPSAAHVAVDPVSLSKRYISASAQYMRGQVDLAVAMGPNPDGYRHFGAGLHVLEDYFAHSNFVELSLRKLGHSKVLPWTSSIDANGTFPVVTGMFASEDVIASMAKTIADIAAPVDWEYKPYVAGKPTEFDEVMLILLEEHSDQMLTKEQLGGRPTLLERYKWMMSARDTWNEIPGQDTRKRISHYTIGSVFNAQNMVMSSLLQQVGHSIDDAQVYARGDPNTNGSTNPSHSQLAKDHDTHQFHTLAALLARIAVMTVGQAIDARWNGKGTVDPGKIASSFLVHPNFCSWQDKYVSNWAALNPEKVLRGESATEFEAIKKEHETEVREQIRLGQEMGNKTWEYVNKHYETIFGKKKVNK